VYERLVFEDALARPKRGREVDLAANPFEDETRKLWVALTSPTHSQRVFAALRGPKRLIPVPGAGHDDALRADVWSAIDAWIDDVVPPVPR
jgi:hypothetical protein